MKRCLVLVFLFVFCFGYCPAAFAQQRETEGIVAKVTTQKGSFNLRAKPGKGGVIVQIPNGTCMLVLEESTEWRLCQWDGKQGYCRTEFLTFLRDADVGLLDFRILKQGTGVKMSWH